MQRPRREVRERAHVAVIIFWLGPGALLSYLWMRSIPWLIFMSWFASAYTAISAWASETPVESEADE